MTKTIEPITEAKDKPIVYKLCSFGNFSSSLTPINVPTAITAIICTAIPEYLA
jgi:hypothetical protein